MTQKYPQVFQNGNGPNAIITLVEGPARTVSAQLSMMQQMAAEGPSSDVTRHQSGPSQQQAAQALRLLAFQQG